jgi:hypothetical protein
MTNSNALVDPRTAAGLANWVGATLQQMLASKVSNPARPAPFYVWVREDRLIVSVDPLGVKSIDQVLSPRFVHHLSTALGGRRVVTTNTRGVYLQISYWPVAAAELVSQPLDLSTQPGPLHVPIGETKRGALWLSIWEVDSVLIGGSSGMGKSTLIHGWVQALIHGGKARLYLYDGKENTEFGRYGESEQVTADADLHKVLEALTAETSRRRAMLTQSGYASVAQYNEVAPLPLPPLVLVIDEAAFIPEDLRGAVTELISKGRAWGVCRVLATQRTGVSEVQALAKTNLTTRIALPVPAWGDSKVILDRTGAEKLPKVPGRIMMVYGARVVQAQAYKVELPRPDGGGKLSAPEVELFARAVRETEGRLSIPILTGWGMSEWKARTALDKWTAEGWLEWGEKNDRRLSSRAVEMISQASQATSSRLKPGSSRAQGTSSQSQADTQPIKPKEGGQHGSERL